VHGTNTIIIRENDYFPWWTLIEGLVYHLPLCILTLVYIYVLSVEVSTNKSVCTTQRN